jgi:hypothetical protein
MIVVERRGLDAKESMYMVCCLFHLKVLRFVQSRFVFYLHHWTWSFTLIGIEKELCCSASYSLCCFRTMTVFGGCYSRYFMRDSSNFQERNLCHYVFWAELIFHAEKFNLDNILYLITSMVMFSSFNGGEIELVSTTFR